MATAVLHGLRDPAGDGGDVRPPLAVVGDAQACDDRRRRGGPDAPLPARRLPPGA